MNRSLARGFGFHSSRGRQWARFSYSYSLVSAAVFFGLKYTVGIRLSPEQELAGSDFSEHGMWGYPEHFVGPDDGTHGTSLADRLRGMPPVEQGKPEPLKA